MLEALNRQCDKIIENEKDRKDLDVSHRLSKHVKGQIQEELHCNLSEDSLSSFRALVFDALYALHQDTFLEHSIPKDKFSITVDGSWYVRSFAGDFNPAHRHLPTENFTSQGVGAMVSFIGYLKIPEGITDNTVGGYIDFLNGVSGNMTRANLLTKPELGDIYFFPSCLSHTVYPFTGEGERRSLSANIQIGKIEENKNV